jgi:hypothetical protein
MALAAGSPVRKVPVATGVDTPAQHGRRRRDVRASSPRHSLWGDASLPRPKSCRTGSSPSTCRSKS